MTGCKIPDCAVMPDFNVLNADMHDERFNTGKLGGDVLLSNRVLRVGLVSVLSQ